MKYKLYLFWCLVLLLSTLCVLGTTPVVASDELHLDYTGKPVETTRMGIHILHTHELTMAKDLLLREERNQRWAYVTVPFTLDDIDNAQQWQDFFDQAKKYRIIPLVRLVTRFENEAWQVPTRKDIISQMSVLGALRWPTNTKHIIIFNEVNHSWEWGGSIDPVGYAQTLRFASEWAKTDNKNFFILASALDLSAPNGARTKDAFAFWREALAYDEKLFTLIDGWNSHSYPNPGFVGTPMSQGKQSIRGFEYELSFLAQYDERTLPVFITETGWKNQSTIQSRLAYFYQYAVTRIWSHPQVVAVTPFVLMGDPGPFADFSFIDQQGKPTAQYLAFQKALRYDVF